jgi:hypothetical protein
LGRLRPAADGPERQEAIMASQVEALACEPVIERGLDFVQPSVRARIS